MAETSTPSTDIRSAIAPINPTQAVQFPKAPITFDGDGGVLFVPATALSLSGQKTWGEAISQQNVTFRDLLAQHKQQARDIHNRRRSSMHDRQVAVSELSDRIADKIHKSAAITEKSLADHLAYHLKNAPKWEPAKTTDPATELRGMQTRDSLKKLDSNMLRVRLASFAATGTPEAKQLIDSVLNDPALPEHRLVNDDDATKLKNIWLRTRHGADHLQMIDDIGQARRILKANKTTALSSIHRHDANQAVREAITAGATAHQPGGSVDGSVKDTIAQIAAGR